MSLIINCLNQDANVVFGIQLDIFEALCCLIEHFIFFARIFQEETNEDLMKRLKFLLFEESRLVDMMLVEVGEVAEPSR